MQTKTYVMGQVWDAQLGANIYTDATLAEASAGFPSLRPDSAEPPTEFEKAGAELDKKARALMDERPGATYQQAFEYTLAANPNLKKIYGGVK